MLCVNGSYLPVANRSEADGPGRPEFVMDVFARRAALVAGIAAMGLLAACATPEQRVRSGLIDAGLSRPMATCMASRMVDRLSLLQLRRIGRLGDLREANVRELSVEQFLHRARAIGDPEILAVMTTSAGLCAIRTR
jgi:hypothetical protein